MQFTNEKKHIGTGGQKGNFWRNFILIAITVFILFCAFIGWIYDWAADALIHNNPEVIVPDIKGKSYEYALETLSKSKLAVFIEKYEYKESEPIGTVIKQLPEPGTTVREGKTIRITVSQGGETVFTPSLKGMTLRNAELLLRQSQLSLGEVSFGYSMKIEKGVILSQDPPSDKSVAKGAMVNVKICDGAPPSGILMMPEFKQKNRKDVEQWAEKNDVKVKYIEDPKSTYANGVVFAQSPEADTQLNGKSKVTVTVSTRKAAALTEGDYEVKYEVPSNVAQRTIRIVAISKNGEREVFNGTKDPGSKINLIIPKQDLVKIRIFVNGIQVKEETVK